MTIDICANCNTPEGEFYYGDDEYTYSFSCSNCPCFDCEYNHSCDGQCME